MAESSTILASYHGLHIACHRVDSILDHAWWFGQQGDAIGLQHHLVALIWLWFQLDMLCGHLHDSTWILLDDIGGGRNQQRTCCIIFFLIEYMQIVFSTVVHLQWFNSLSSVISIVTDIVKDSNLDPIG